MARTSRNNMKDSSFFHIMVQGINQEYIFNTQKNKQEYLELLYANNKDVKIIAYCIMDNHAHILVETDVIYNMQTWMKKVNTSYAIYYNKKNDRVGYVFRNRYKSQSIKNEKHLYLCIEYIHNNPIKAGICEKKEKYTFSSYSKIYQGSQTSIQKKVAQMLSQSKMQTELNKQEVEEKFEFMENEKEKKEEKCQKVISDFLESKKMDIEDLKRQKQYLREIVGILKYKNNISYRIMEKYLKISRETLRMLTMDIK